MAIFFATKDAQFYQIGSVPTKYMPSEMVRFLREMWNVLNRMKIEINFFAIFVSQVIVKIHRNLG